MSIKSNLMSSYCNVCSTMKCDTYQFNCNKYVFCYFYAFRNYNCNYLLLPCIDHRILIFFPNDVFVICVYSMSRPYCTTILHWEQKTLRSSISSRCYQIVAEDVQYDWDTISDTRQYDENSLQKPGLETYVGNNLNLCTVVVC